MENLLAGLALIVILGVAAQWIAWRCHLPSILLLVLFGALAGMHVRFLQPDRLFGSLLMPFISLSVGLILFEGGLSLKFSEFRQIGSVLARLISLGALVTWVIAGVSAYLLLDLEGPLAILFGAVVLVTGPTVIIPLLQQLRLTGRSGSILKWEGIVIDPLGAALTVLVFEALLAGGFQMATLGAIRGAVVTLLAGAALGFAGARVLVFLFKRYWVPDFLQTPMALTVVLAVFVLANHAQRDSGLLAVTLMGIFLANQKQVSIKHIIEFKENLRVLLISSLFIVLSARVPLTDLWPVPWRAWLFLGILIVVARPLSVWLATLGSSLQRREKWLLAGIAPRGIVAAAVASVFGLRLAEAGFANAEALVTLTFFVILGTVLVYGVGGPILARVLKLSQTNPQGVLIVGGHAWARALAKLLQQHKVKVVLVDSNPSNVYAARRSDLSACCGNILSEEITEKIDLEGIGKLIALTPNDEVNAMAALHFRDLFGRQETYHLSPKEGDAESLPGHLTGRLLMNKDASFGFLDEKMKKGGQWKVVPVEKEMKMENVVPIFLLGPESRLDVFAADHPPKPQPGQTVIALQTP